MSTSNIYYMNKCFIYIFTICALISCQKIDEIKFNIDYFEIDYQAQEVILKTDKNIWMATYDVASSDTEFVDHYTENGISYSVGEWFVVIHKHSNHRQAVVSVEENQTDKDRKVVIWVNDVDDNIDYATIVQKAKPTE
jgi:hypothetical protein